MDLLRYQAELRRERPAAGQARRGDEDVRGRVGWIIVGVMVGVVLCLASLAISFATHSARGLDPLESHAVRGAPFPWIEQTVEDDPDAPSVLRWRGLTASLIFWTVLGGTVAGFSYRRWTQLRRWARVRDGEIPFAESSVLARGLLSLFSMLLAWAIVMIPTFLSLDGAPRTQGGASAACTIVMWALCILPVVAMVDERSEVFSFPLFALVVGGLTSLLAVITVVPMLITPKPPVIGLIGGGIYAIALRWLRMWSGYTVEAEHVPW